MAGRVPFGRTFQALRHRDYRLYWLALSISLLGVAFQTVAQAWLVYRLTGSALMLGVVGFIPAVLSVPASIAGGVIADRVSRRKLVIVTQSLMAIPPIALGILIAAGRVQVWHVVAASIALGIVAAIDLPSRTAMIPHLVPPEDLMNAQGLASASRQVAQIIGPALAGIVIAVAGESMCFLINGLTYLAMATAVFLMRPQPAAGADKRRGVGGALVDGARYLWEHAVILGLFCVLAAQGLFLSPLIMLMPVYAKDILGLGAAGLGWLNSAIGVGALIGALVVSNLGQGRRGRILMMGGAFMPLILALLAWSRWIALSIPLLMLMGFGTVILTAISATMLLTLIPDVVRGRIMSLAMMVYLGTPYLAGLPAGALAQRAGAPLTLTLGAFLFLVSLVVINIKFPAVRRLA
jgi:MFS family permease